MLHAGLRRFEAQLKALFDEVDAFLEERYGDTHTLHPARPRRGKTANPEHDGLFNIGAAFSVGFGSEFGRGYVIEVRMVTLERVHENEREDILAAAIARIRELLALHFSDRRLSVERDGTVFKIVGDFVPQA